MSHIGAHTYAFRNNTSVDDSIKPCYCRTIRQNNIPSRTYRNAIVKVRHSDNLVVDIIDYPTDTPVRFYDKRYLYYAQLLGTLDAWNIRVGSYYIFPGSPDTAGVPILYDN